MEKIENNQPYNGTILALDTASRKTGYALYRGGKIYNSGTLRMKEVTRFADLYQQITQLVIDHKITYIIAEDIFKDTDPRKKSAYQVLCECRGIVELIAQQHKIPYNFIPPMRIKNYLIPTIGYRKRTHSEYKDMIIRAVLVRGYVLEKDNADDEADAIAMLIYYIEGCSKYLINHPANKRLSNNPISRE